MIEIVNPPRIIWAILRLYVTTLICLIPLCFCLLYSVLRLIKCNDASEAGILCSLAGCAFYGIVISSLWKEDIETAQLKPKADPILLRVFILSKSAGKETVESRQLRDMASPCAICLEDYNEGDEICCGERCNHAFHASCIVQWTELHHTGCPCCRQHLLSQQNLVVSSIFDEVRFTSGM